MLQSEMKSFILAEFFSLFQWELMMEIVIYAQ
jgi:hypothetical protein